MRSRRLLENRVASYHGTYYQFDDVQLQPFIGTMPDVWVAGGSRVPDPTDDPDIHDTYGYIHPSVVRRILKWKHWLSRCSGTQEWVIRDWNLIREEARKAGDDPEELVFGHCNFTYFTAPRRARRPTPLSASPSCGRWARAAPSSTSATVTCSARTPTSSAGWRSLPMPAAPTLCSAP